MKSLDFWILRNSSYRFLLSNSISFFGPFILKLPIWEWRNLLIFCNNMKLQQKNLMKILLSVFCAFRKLQQVVNFRYFEVRLFRNIVRNSHATYVNKWNKFHGFYLRNYFFMVWQKLIEPRKLLLFCDFCTLIFGAKIQTTWKIVLIG